jgi:hypothetical protein
MRTPLLTLAATLTLFCFATTSVATTTGAASGGGGFSGGGVSAPSGGGGSSSGSSHGGMGGGGGSVHGGAGAGRGGEFSGGHGYGNLAAQVTDIAHGGYRVLDTRPASVIATGAISTQIARGPLVLGPALGSAAKAALMTDRKRGVTGSAPPRHPHPHPPRRGLRSESTECSPSGCEMPSILCPLWDGSDGDHYEMNTPLDCPRPRKLAP